MFALNDQGFAADNVVSQACSLPVLTDTQQANVYGLLGVQNKDYVYVWDKQGLLASYFAPWQMTMTNPDHQAYLVDLLTALAK